MNREDIKALLSFVLNFSITASGTLIGAMLETGNSDLPKQGVFLLAILLGFGQASLQAKALLEGRPPENIKDTIQQLVMQMKNIQTIQAVTTPPEIKEVLNAPPIKVPEIKLPIDPKRSSGTDV